MTLKFTLHSVRRFVASETIVHCSCGCLLRGHALSFTATCQKLITDVVHTASLVGRYCWVPPKSRQQHSPNHFGQQIQPQAARQLLAWLGFSKIKRSHHSLHRSLPHVPLGVSLFCARWCSILIGCHPQKSLHSEKRRPCMVSPTRPCMVGCSCTLF